MDLGWSDIEDGLLRGPQLLQGVTLSWVRCCFDKVSIGIVRVREDLSDKSHIVAFSGRHFIATPGQHWRCSMMESANETYSAETSACT